MLLYTDEDIIREIHMQIIMYLKIYESDGLGATYSKVMGC